MLFDFLVSFVRLRSIDFDYGSEILIYGESIKYNILSMVSCFVCVRLRSKIVADSWGTVIAVAPQ